MCAAGIATALCTSRLALRQNATVEASERGLEAAFGYSSSRRIRPSTATNSQHRNDEEDKSRAISTISLARSLKKNGSELIMTARACPRFIVAKAFQTKMWALSRGWDASAHPAFLMHTLAISDSGRPLGHLVAAAVLVAPGS
jgi:hypothetical protein